jgi:hypothetical protein
MLKPIRRPELARIRQEEVLFSAPEADVDEDVVFADLGRLEHLEAELLLTLLVALLARYGLAVVTCGPSAGIPGRPGTDRTGARWCG